jgi:hypothetical protein
MENLMEKWKTKIPNYSIKHKGLFDSLSTKFGPEGEKTISLGKHFSTNYELYIYAFFLGLYNDVFEPIPQEEKKINFSYLIQKWGSKTSPIREDFTSIQENIFMAVFVKSDLNLEILEKGEISEDDAVKTLIHTLESYTNGGLALIQEKIDKSPNYFIQPTSFLYLIMESKTA